MVVIEMNPRVSRSSALASKATGFPIAKIARSSPSATRWTSCGTRSPAVATPASFEPSIDYVVTKVPRFAFEKFKEADDRLTTQMKSVGEVMAIGRTFQESLQKALRGLETGVDGFNLKTVDPDKIGDELAYPRAERLWYVADAFGVGMSVEEIHRYTKIDPWFLAQIKEIVDVELLLEQRKLPDIAREDLRALKRMGFADRRIAHLLKVDEGAVRAARHELGLRPVYKRVTRAPPSSRRRPPTSTRHTKRNPKPRRPIARR
jgi:carbamoyl-phosphate synthase large subunit